MNSKNTNTSVLITGIQTDIEREQILTEFKRFGQPTKLYIDKLGRYAKVYFPDIQSCYNAFKGLKRNTFNWILHYQENKEEAFNFERNITQESHNDNSARSSQATNQTTMDDSYCDEEFTENSNYCNIHGQILTVLQGDTGDFYINLKDIRQTGFAIFRTETFDVTLADRNQINREFELHLLSEAKRYILHNRVHSIDEDTILRTIENCKTKLLGRQINFPINQNLQERVVYSDANSFSISTNNRSNENRGFQYRDNAERSKEQTTDSRWNEPGNSKSYHPENRNRSQENRNRSQENRNRSQENRNQSQENQNRSQGNRGHNQRQSFGSFDNKNHQDRNERRDKKQDNQFEAYCGYGGFDNKNQHRNQGNDKKNNQFESPFADLSENFQSSRVPKNLPANFVASNKQAQSSFQQESKKFNNDNSNNNSKFNHQKVGSSSSSTSSDTRRVDFGDKLQKVPLEIGSVYMTKICYLEPNKENICWVNEEKSIDQLEQLMLDIFELEPTLTVLENLRRGDLVLSLFDNTWCRAVVINNNTVQYLDYGNQNTIESCKPLPANLQKIPALAIRLVISRNKITLVDDMQIKIKILKKYDDDTYLVDMLENSVSSSRRSSITKIELKAESPDPQPVCPPEKKDSVPSVEETKLKPQIENQEMSTSIEEKKRPRSATDFVDSSENVYFEIPKPVHTLKNGDTVAIVEFEKLKLFIKTKECMEQAKKIKAHIKTLDKSDLVLNNIKEGQLILSSKDGMEGLCRAVVVEKQSSLVASIKYIDYPGIDTLSIKSLRNVDEFLAKEPAALFVFENVEILKGLGIPSKNYLAELVGRKEKLVIQISDKNEIDFLLQNGELLSESFQNLKKPKDVTKTFKEQEIPIPKQEPRPSTSQSEESNKNVKIEKVFYDDMSWMQVNPGIHEFICYTINSASDLNLVLQRDDVIQHMELLTELQIEDQKPFKPDVTEMCLVYNEQDGLWERAVVFNVEDGDYGVSTVDFGTELTVKSDKLRSFPSYLKDVPVIGMPCELDGIPDNPKVTKILKEMIVEGENLTAKILKYNEETMKYKIEHKQVQEKLKDEGLC